MMDDLNFILESTPFQDSTWYLREVLGKIDMNPMERRAIKTKISQERGRWTECMYDANLPIETFEYIRGDEFNCVGIEFFGFPLKHIDTVINKIKAFYEASDLFEVSWQDFRSNRPNSTLLYLEPFETEENTDHDIKYLENELFNHVMSPLMTFECLGTVELVEGLALIAIYYDRFYNPQGFMAFKVI
jgi:hypothetical protein